MFKWFLNWLENNGRKNTILDRTGNDPYLNRWYVWYPDSERRKKQDIPFNVFIHQFLQSDDPVLHDHPFWFISIVLKGGYWEHLQGGIKKWRAPGSIRFNSGGFHWVEIEEPGKTWTLFIRGRKCREWGFLFNGVWMPEDKYLEMMRKTSK